MEIYPMLLYWKNILKSSYYPKQAPDSTQSLPKCQSHFSQKFFKSLKCV
jgi:hypothetical protein